MVAMGADGKRVYGIARRSGFKFYDISDDNTYTLADGWEVRRVHVGQWEILLWDSLLCHAGSDTEEFSAAFWAHIIPGDGTVELWAPPPNHQL